MDLALNSLGHAVELLTHPAVLFAIAVAVVWGACCGVLPGVGSGLGIGVVVPLTFSMDAVTAVAFLVTISVAVSFSNSLPAVLLGVPASPAAFLTAIDGYALHKQGKSGLALGSTLFGAVLGQLVSIPFFVLLVVPLSTLTYTFLSPELFALYCLGLVAVVSLTGKNVIKGLMAAALGVAISLVGPDPVNAVARFSFDVPELRGGFQTIPAVLGLVTISEIIRSMRQNYNWEDILPTSKSMARFPGFRALKPIYRPVATGALIGTLIGAIPGMSGTASAVMSYQQAKLTSKTPEKFGKGSIEGVAANESAANASQAGEMVPTLGLGIPGSDSMVLVLGALMLQGFVPGPMLMQESPELLHATVAGLLGGSLLLLAFGWPLARLLLRVIHLDRRVILPLVFVVTHVGIYSLRQSLFDVIVLLGFGIIGYFMIRYGYSTAAAAIGLLLGAGFESNLRQGMLLADSSFWQFVSRPWTASILLAALALLAYGIYGTVKTTRRERAQLAAAQNQPPV
ncbi:tripartite tricarboxylate transporter permease [Jiangella mangrovi]|uniref:Putative tricarboxylic transport membrane protein n=1 Tax=Jiangella mangrovi TaxID=1524084 RepID=A0A7W9LND2_9ACTN|nr:tripartite tricarboxylate transporter permease [Jiangella mangrovi]MBB5790124.1 putative tricarboxylic transport membrane protein [Jiangella mangrovi]